jgi:acyl dehydratase
MDWPDLPERAEVPFAEFRETIGATHVSPWIQLGQEDFDRFAEATGDDATIHTDPEFATKTRFGGTIAHGLFVLSLLPRLARWAMPLITDSRIGVNYGFDSVRFLTPVPCGGRVRGRFTLEAVEPRERGLWTIRHQVVMDLENHAKPALSADWMIGRWIRADV